MTIKLKPCAHCGASCTNFGTTNKRIEGDRYAIADHYWVVCQSCPARVRVKAEGQAVLADAIAAWNRRP